MTRTICLAVILAVALPIAGCGKRGDPLPPDPETKKETPEE